MIKKVNTLPKNNKSRCMLFRDMEVKNKGISYKGRGNGGVEERVYCFSQVSEYKYLILYPVCLYN